MLGYWNLTISRNPNFAKISGNVGKRFYSGSDLKADQLQSMTAAERKRIKCLEQCDFTKIRVSKRINH